MESHGFIVVKVASTCSLRKCSMCVLGVGGRGEGGFEERRSQPAVPTQRRPSVRPTEEGDDERQTLVVPPRDVLLRLPLELGEVEEVVVDGPG